MAQLYAPYQLEQQINYSAKSSLNVTSVKYGGPRLNRYYESLAPYYKKQGREDTTLIFESRFESGNLHRAIKVGEFEYDLHLKNDYGTTGYTQWYHFRVQNTKANQTYRFNIVNLMKPDSNYNQGMKPLLYSVTKAEKD